MTIGILDYVWSDSFEQQHPSRMSPIARMLNSLLAAPMVCFVSDLTSSRVAAGAWVAGEEVFPGATLADVLSEEFDIDVTEETIIYVEPREMCDMEYFPNSDVRRAIGDVLAGLAKPNIWGSAQFKQLADEIGSLQSASGRARRSAGGVLQ